MLPRFAFSQVHLAPNAYCACGLFVSVMTGQAGKRGTRRGTIGEELTEHRLARRKKHKPEAALWVSWPNTEGTIDETAFPVGFAEGKVCAVSEGWSELKLVVRKELRQECPLSLLRSFSLACSGG